MITPRPARADFDDEDREDGNSSYSDASIKDIQFWIDHPSLDDLTADQAESERQQVRRDVEDCIRLLNSAPNQLGNTLDDADEAETVRSRYAPDQQRYTVIKLLGVGAFGVVLHAKDRVLNREVALKILRPSVLLSKQARTRFSIEGEALARCNCEGIVPIYEVGQIDGNPYLVMRLVEGMTLAEYVKELESPLEGPVAARIVASIADAVHRAHQRGILHRDLKPSNVLLEHNDGSRSGSRFNLFVSDFGLAKDLLPNPNGLQGDASADSPIIGTVRYMSPEQATGLHGEVSITSDVFSLGVILYELLTLECPFSGTTTFEIIHQVATASAKSPRQLNSKVARDLNAIVGRCLAKRPSERYQSASELSDDLNRFLVGKPVVAKPAGPIKTIVFWARRNPSLALASMAIWCGLFVGTIAIAYLYRRASEATIRADASRSFALTSADQMLRYMAEVTLENVPQTSQKKLDLHLLSLKKNEEYAELRGYDEESVNRLQIAHHYVANDAFNCQNFELASVHRIRCLEILHGLAERHPRNGKYRFDIFMNRFLTHSATMSHDEHLAWLIETRGHLQTAINLSTFNPDYEEADAAICVAIGHAALEARKGSARDWFALAISNLTELTQKYPDKIKYYKHLIGGHGGMASVNINEQQWKLACEHSLQELDLIENYYSQSNDIAEIQTMTLSSLDQYARALEHLDKVKAIAVLDRFISETTEIENREPKFKYYQLRRAGAFLSQARLHHELGDLPSSKKALADANKSLENYRPALASEAFELSAIETKILEFSDSLGIPSGSF